MPDAATETAFGDTPPGFEHLRPLSPLPRAYLLQLEWRKAHPHNRPEYDGDASAHRGAWMSVASGYERGKATRDAELLAIQRQSGWDPSDSPAVSLPPVASQPVLTGNAWHWGRGACPPACRANGGVCLPALGRCDCPRHRWGAACELVVQPAVSRTEMHHGWCVYNDSSPFFCDKPLCEQRGVRPCVGVPLDQCPERCNGKGVCVGRGRCACIPGYTGSTCTRAVRWHCVSNCLGRGSCEMGFCQCRKPYYGVDCSLQPMGAAMASQNGADLSLPAGHLGLAAPSQTAAAAASGASGAPAVSATARARGACMRPCVYVYELPARMNVLALKAEPHWPFYEHGPADYRAYKAVHISLLRSAHRTTNPERADYFYVPTWDLHGSWGNHEVYWRAQRYVSSVWPFWNRTHGADHIWTNTRDAGGCSNPWGSIWDQTRHSILLSNWGAVTGLGGVPTERCFDATRDLTIPGVLRSRIVAKSPFLAAHQRFPDDHLAAAQAATADMAAPAWSARQTLLFFHGALCWQTYDKVRSLEALSRKCAHTHGFLNHYSFGVRWEVYRRFHAEPGFHLRATDLLPGPPHADLDTLTLRSIFCLCPSGTGWGMRVFHSVALGCIPVIIQRDDKNAYPPGISPYLAISRHISPYLLRSPHNSSYLLRSSRISPYTWRTVGLVSRLLAYLPISPLHGRPSATFSERLLSAPRSHPTSATGLRRSPPRLVDALSAPRGGRHPQPAVYPPQARRQRDRPAREALRHRARMD